MIDLRLVRHHEIPPALFGDVLPVLDALHEAERELRASRAVIDDLSRQQRCGLYVAA